MAGWQGFLNNNDIRRDRGRSEFDVDHRLVSSFVYELPFGHGKKFGNNLPKIADVLIGGWQVNSIVTFQSGFPMTISAADVGGLNDTSGTNRADLVGTPRRFKPSPSGSTPQLSGSPRRGSSGPPAAAF